MDITKSITALIISAIVGTIVVMIGKWLNLEPAYLAIGMISYHIVENAIDN